MQMIQAFCGKLPESVYEAFGAPAASEFSVGADQTLPCVLLFWLRMLVELFSLPCKLKIMAHRPQPRNAIFDGWVSTEKFCDCRTLKRVRKKQMRRRCIWLAHS